MRTFFRNLALFGAVALLLAGSFQYGYQRGYDGGKENPKVIRIEGVTNLEAGKPEAVNFSLFWEAWNTLQEKYVDIDAVDAQALLYGAINGTFGSLEDENTVFFPPVDADRFSQDISGEFSGIGAEISIRNNQLVIVSPLKGTPADQAGLRPGDAIFQVDERSTDGITLDEAVSIIRGSRGTTVVLLIGRSGWDEPREISIVRDIIQIPTLDWEVREDNIAYLHLYNFYELAPRLFPQAAIEMRLRGVDGLVLDLRNNPGGFLSIAVDIAGWFLDGNLLVVSEDFGDDKEEFRSSGTGLLRDLPMVILVNEGSASASEILAGAIRDHRGVPLVGTKTFGKGTVQELIQLSGKAMAKVTVAHWRLPGGDIIEKNGLTPDYEIELTEDDIENDRDPQFEKAVEVLKEQL